MKSFVLLQFLFCSIKSLNPSEWNFCFHSITTCPLIFQRSIQRCSSEFWPCNTASAVPRSLRATLPCNFRHMVSIRVKISRHRCFDGVTVRLRSTLFSVPCFFPCMRGALELRWRSFNKLFTRIPHWRMIKDNTFYFWASVAHKCCFCPRIRGWELILSIVTGASHGTDW